MRILVCGSRYWGNKEEIAYQIEHVLLETYSDLDTACAYSTIIEGGARGADYLARCYAEAKGIKVETYLADWPRLGPKAGPIRNERMLNEGNPHFVLAFHEDIVKSKGTKDMIFQANKAGIEVRLYGKV